MAVGIYMIQFTVYIARTKIVKSCSIYMGNQRRTRKIVLFQKRIYGLHNAHQVTEYPLTQRKTQMRSRPT